MLSYLCKSIISNNQAIIIPKFFTSSKDVKMIRSFLYIVILIIPKWAFSAIRFRCIVAIFGVVECRDQIRKVRGTDEKFV